jgi:uncharacterized protein
MLPICGSCGRRWFPPTPGCPRCGSTQVRLEEADPRGAVYSWVVINRALNPAFSHDAPYTITAVDLTEGARMVGRFLSEATIQAGMPVRVDIYEVDGHRLVGFRPDQR